MDGSTVRGDDGYATKRAMLVLTAIAVGIALLQRVLTPKMDPREPPLVPSKIPVVGHLISLIRQGQGYYGAIK